MTNDEKKCWSHKDAETPATSNMRGAEEEEEEVDGEETSPPPPRRPTRPLDANPREFPRFVPRAGGGDSWRDGETADNLLLRPLGRYLAPAAYVSRGIEIDEDQVRFPTRLEGRGIPEAIASRYSAQDALNCERGRALRSSAHSSTRTYQGSSGTDDNSNSTGESGSGVVRSTPLEVDELPAEASAVGGGGSSRPEPVRGPFSLRPIGSDDDDDDDDSDDEPLPGANGGPRPHGGRPRPAPAPAAVAAPAPAQVANDFAGLDVDATLVATMPLRRTNTPEVVALLRNSRPQHMDAALWDRFLSITSEAREAVNQWETRQQALAALPQLLHLTLARIEAEGFTRDGRGAAKALSRYTKQDLRPVRPANFDRFPPGKVLLAQKGLTERYSDVKKNGARLGACAKLHSQMVDNNMYWRELMTKCLERESKGWPDKRSKGTGKGAKGNGGNGKGKKGKGKDETTTTTKTPAKKRKRDEDDDGEEREETEDDDEEE